MDIENMHPFCLPFGFCHDATSSSITADFDPLINNNNNGDNSSIAAAAATSNDISSNNGNNKDKIRFKTSSPSDELFRHLNQTNHSLTGGHSLLNGGDLIIGSSSTLDINCGESFYSLELDINIDDVDSSLETGTDIDFIADANGKEHQNNDDDDDDIDDMKGDNHQIIDDDDWFSNQYSLFSPTSGSHPSDRRKSLIRTALATTSGLHHLHNNQVFQHVVDPIDIKSSPTLAQLNLNTNDDPTEGLWGETISGSTSTTNQIDLLSNCTSITGIRHHHSSSHTQQHHHHHHHLHLQHNNNNHVTCNHLNHHHQQQQPQHPHHNHHAHNNQHHVPLSSSFHHHHNSQPNNIAPTTLLNCNNHHHHQQTGGGCASSNGADKGGCNNCDNNSTCNSDNGDSSCGNRFASSCNSTQAGHCNGGGLLSSTFRKPDLHQHSSSCCSNLLTTTSAPTCNPQQQQQQNLNNGQNLKPSPTLNQLNFSTINNNNNNNNNDSHHQSMIRQQLISIDKHNQQKLCQQRSASPALVTSSSSPLSSSSSSVGSNGTSENRSIDNKLKENIEYLTALLCNGNKLDYNNQQPSISSTMVRSYATLAHSLSTGPKLLERQQLNMAAQLAPRHNQQQQHQMLLAQQQQQKPITNLQQQASLGKGPTNEASSCVDGSQQQLQVGGNGTLKRPYSDQWFKLAADSSVSPADSTESQVSSLTPGDRGQLHHHCPTAMSSSCPNHHIMQQTSAVTQLNSNHQQVPSQPQQAIDQMRQRSSELKVLSSLLSSNKCTTPTTCANLLPPAASAVNNGQVGGWEQDRTSCQQQQQPNIQQVAQSAIGHESSMGQISYHPTGGPMQQVNESQSSTTINKQAHQEQASSIPLNGKPITLTPIATNNGILIQQQQQQAQKPRVSLFAQPASPSASSTASSGASVTTGGPDIGSTSASVSTPATKRQRGSNPQQSTNNQKAAICNNSNRSARPSSMSTDCSLSSHDEGFSSQIDNDDCGSARDSDDEDDIDSDDESFYGDYTNSDLIGASISDNVENKWTLNMGRTRRNGQKRYFWQYNVQSKGPKGTRICSTDDSEDPFVLPEASDPVFSNDCQVEGVKHSGKARRGDGNDLTPNPRKLLMIGLELKKLGKIINELAPVTDLPVNARNKTRKEKNKLASRACRLKKKAQHEANKIKLYGLQREHQQVVMAIYDIRKLLNKTMSDREAKELSNENKQQQQQSQTTEQNSASNSEAAVSITANNNYNNNNGNVNSSAENIAEQCSMKVAGQTSDYVNSVLEKVVSGCIDGGLQT